VNISSADDQGTASINRVSSDVPELTDRLGYLLKHVHLRLSQRTTAALAPFGIHGRELAVLTVLASGEPASQQEAAGRLEIDRTTMVALLDVLEDKGLVARRPDAHDRRRNVVALTELGSSTLRDATLASEDAERGFLAGLSPQAAKDFRVALQLLVRPEA
jgi:DNA-binding MarR family transcriptional regulator